MQLIAGKNLTHHMSETHKTMLDLVVSTEEELLLDQKIHNIADYQIIPFLIQTEKLYTSSEKYNYNFRIANFDAIRA